MGKSDTNPYLNPAIAVELTMRERQALMDSDDWGHLLDRMLDGDSHE